MNNLRLIVVWLYLICLVCGLLVVALTAYDFWHKTTTGEGARFAIYQDAGVGTFAFINTALFGFILARRGSNLLGPLVYLAVSATQSFYAMVYAISFDKSGIWRQDVFAQGGYWGIGVFTPLSEVALSIGVVLGVTAAGLAWNWFMSSWRGLDEGLLYRWTEPLRSKKAAV